MENFNSLAKAVIKQHVSDDYIYKLAPNISKAEDIQLDANNEESYFCNIENLGLLYMRYIEKAKTKKNGSYYTSSELAENMTKILLSEVSPNDTYLDFTCGSGVFLSALAKQGISCQYIFGIDEDPVACELTRINLFTTYKSKGFKNLDELASILNTNIICENSLLHNKNIHIIGNPPWGYQYSPEDEENIRNRFICAKEKSSFDSFAVFLEHAINISEKSIYLLVPESILTVESHKKIREIILANTNIERIEILGEKFSGVMCPCISLMLSKFVVNDGNIIINNNSEEYTLKINDSDITSKSFNIYIKPGENRFVQNIERLAAERGAVYLSKKNCTFGMGIVTGDNKKYLFNDKESSNHEIILSGKNIQRYQIDFGTKKYIDYSDPMKYQQVANINFYRAEEKLLYKFISRELVFAYDNNRTLHLNSCNGIIPRIEFISMKYILALLNSEIIKHYYRLKFHSIKVLASYLMEIPIIIPDMNIHNKIIDLVNLLLIKYNENTNNDVNRLISLTYKTYK